MDGGIMLYLWVAAGGAIGAMSRFWFSGFIAQWFGETFPWGTIIVNITGCFAIGFAATAMGPDGRMFYGGSARTFFMVGVCGGYTTFSSFSLQTLNLVNDGEILAALGNTVLSVVACYIAVWLGHVLAMNLNAMRWV
jgi:CrcB protein